MSSLDQSINDNLKSIIKVSPFIFIGIMISKFSVYLLRVIIARYFGPETYGLFSISLMMIGIFVAFASLGLAEGSVRYIAFYRGKNDLQKIRFLYKFAVTTSWISSILFGVVLFLSSRIISIEIFKDPGLEIFLKISSIIVPATVISNLYLSVIRAYERATLYSFNVNILQNIIKFLALFLLVYLGFKTNSIMFSYFIGVLVMGIFSYYILKTKIFEIFGKSTLNKKEKLEIKRELFYYSAPLVFSNLLIVAYYWIDSFVIGYFNGTTAVGFYNAAFPVALLFTIIPDLFIQIFYPMISKEYSNKNLDLIKELSKQISKWIFIINLPLCIALIIFPGAVLNILFGKEYLVVENVLRILSIGGFVSIFNALLSSLLLMKGKSKLILINFIITSITNLILDIILVPLYGMKGAAIATSIVGFIFSSILFWEVSMNFKFVPLKRKMINIFFSSIIPILFLVMMSKYLAKNIWTLIFAGLSFLILYTFFLILFKSLDERDLNILKSIKRKLTQWI